MKDFLSESVEHAKDTLLKEGEMLPMFVAYSSNHVGFIIVTPWRDEREKALIVNYLRLLFIAESVTEYCFMTEMWFKGVKSLEDRPSGMICDQPDKKEGLLVLHTKLEFGKITSDGKMFETIRANKKIELKPMEGGRQLGGTFTELLSIKPIHPEEREALKAVLKEIEKRNPIGMKRYPI